MGDVGDYWREHRDYLKSQGIKRSRPKPRATLVKFSKKFERAGFRKCSDWHWQIRIGGELLNFWPSKSKWQFNGETHIGADDELLEFVARTLAEQSETDGAS